MTAKRITFVTLLAVALSFTAALAAKDPLKGTWRWNLPAGTGNANTERTLTLLPKERDLLGKIWRHECPQGPIPDQTIRHATFQDGAIAFIVHARYGEKPVALRYRGQVRGDTIRGTIERSGIDGGSPVKVAWVATRLR